MVMRKVNISATSENEFKMRVEDLEKRGYKLKTVAPVERPEHREVSYDSTLRGSSRKRDSYMGFERHRAVMEKDFEEAIK